MECQSRHWPDARDRQEAPQGWIIADETADFLVKHRHLGSGNLPNVEQFLDECRQDWMVLREHPCSLGEGSFVATAHDQTEGLQNAADLTVDLDPDVDEPTANAEQRHSFIGREALDLNLLQPTHTHHLGEPPRVITIGLDGANRKGGMGVASIHADHWKTCSFQRMPEPC